MRLNQNSHFKHYLVTLKVSVSILFSSQLMAKEPLEKLGFRDLMDPPPSQTEENTKPWAAAPQLPFPKGWCFSERCSNEVFIKAKCEFEKNGCKDKSGGLQEDFVILLITRVHNIKCVIYGAAVWYISKPLIMKLNYVEINILSTPGSYSVNSELIKSM